MRTAVVVFNPVAGRRRSRSLLADVLACLGQSGFDPTPLPTRSPGDAETRAREAAAGGAEVIFALGGDGTLRECAAGILGSEAALAFLPTGTTNVMALELGVPSRPLDAARSYASAGTARFGVGLAGKIPFLMQVSAGVDAYLIGSLRSAEKRWLGRASAVPAVLRSLANYSFPFFDVETQTGTHRVTLAVASNIVRYGGPLRLTPEASSDGNALELFLFSGRGRGAAICFGLSLLLGRHLRMRSSSLERVRQATFFPAPGMPGVPFQIDGDVLAPEPQVPIEISLAADTLRILVPSM